MLKKKYTENFDLNKEKKNVLYVFSTHIKKNVFSLLLNLNLRLLAPIININRDKGINVVLQLYIFHIFMLFSCNLEIFNQKALFLLPIFRFPIIGIYYPNYGNFRTKNNSIKIYNPEYRSLIIILKIKLFIYSAIWTKFFK